MEKIYIAIPLDRTDSIPTFYDKVAEELGFNPEFITYDPRKIWVSDRRAKNFEKVYGSEFAYAWCSYGPKVDYSLKGAVVLVDIEFIQVEDFK